MPRKKRVFSAYNAHTPSCGQPPHIETDGHAYYGYYENYYGEQWVLRYDTSTGVVTLQGGDAGWDQTFEVNVREGGWALQLPVLNPKEQEWLSVCIRTAAYQAGHKIGNPLR